VFDRSAWSDYGAAVGKPVWLGLGALGILVWVFAQISGHLVVALWVTGGFAVGLLATYAAFAGERTKRLQAEALPSTRDSTSEPFPAPMSYRVDVARQLIANLPPHINEFNIWAVKTMLERTPGRKRKDLRLEPIVFHELQPAFEELVKLGELERTGQQQWRVIKKP
jgi:hypothetical protein